MATLKYVRIFTGPDNLSHFEDIEVDLADQGQGSLLSKLFPSTGINMRRNNMNYDLDWHPAPRRQFVVNLTGQVEITASDGEKRTFGAGSIMLADDTTGKGHLSKHVGDEERVSIFIHIPADQPIPR
jgi:hypothetical protein